jgi:hypothetical protein
LSSNIYLKPEKEKKKVRICGGEKNSRTMWSISHHAALDIRQSQGEETTLLHPPLNVSNYKFFIEQYVTIQSEYIFMNRRCVI